MSNNGITNFDPGKILTSEIAANSHPGSQDSRSEAKSQSTETQSGRRKSESNSQPQSSERVPQFPAVIDSTLLSTFSSCPLKSYRSSFINLTSNRKSIHLHAGACFAKGIECVRRYYWEEKYTAKVALEVAYEDFCREWGPDGDELVPSGGSGANKTFDRVWGAVEDYFREYPIHSDPIRPYRFDNGRSGIEFTFAIPIDGFDHPDTGDPLMFSGRADLLGYYNGMLALVDEKTASALGSSWADQWTMRGQFFGYVWAARKSGLDVKATVIRGISILKTKYGHVEVPKLNYPQFMLDRWEQNMRYKVTQMLNLYRTTKVGYEHHGHSVENFWPMSFGEACNSYGQCQYTDLCTSEKPSRWYSDFGHERWNPIAELEAKAKLEEQANA